MTSSPAPQQFTYEQVQRAIAVWSELGKQPMYRPTPEQELEFYRRADDDLALHLIRGRQDAAERATRCFEAHHDGLQEDLRWTTLKLSEAYDTVRELSDAILRITEPSE